MIKVLYDFIKLTTSAKISFYRHVIQAFGSSMILTAPDIAIEDAIAAVDALEAAYINALNGDRVAIATRRDCEDAADAIFRIYAAYTERRSNGDPTSILSGGFNPSHIPATHQKPDLAIKKGLNSGDVILDARTINRAHAYRWRYSKGPLPTKDEDWNDLGSSTQASFPVSGLEVGVMHHFSVSGITPEGVTDYCATVSIIVT